MSEKSQESYRELRRQHHPKAQPEVEAAPRPKNSSAWEEEGEAERQDAVPNKPTNPQAPHRWRSKTRRHKRSLRRNRRTIKDRILHEHRCIRLPGRRLWRWLLTASTTSKTNQLIDALDTSSGTGNRGDAGGVVAHQQRRRACFAAFSAARRSRTASEAYTRTMHISIKQHTNRTNCFPRYIGFSSRAVSRFEIVCWRRALALSPTELDPSR